MKKIVIIQGHPDASEKHYCHGLAEAYASGAETSGFQVKTVSVAELDFPLLRSAKDYNEGSPPEAIEEAQNRIKEADHIVMFYPLWEGTMPALLKGFFEQLLRPGFAIENVENAMPKRLLKGKSARIVITMGMPALVYRWYFGAHSLKSFKRNVLKLCGISPVKDTLIGMVDSLGDAKRKAWLEKMHGFGKNCK